MDFTPVQIWMLGLLVLTIMMFLMPRFREDMVALGVLVLLGASLWLPGVPDLLERPEQLFVGFSSNAVMAVVAVMILGAGLEASGLMRMLADRLLGLSRDQPDRLFLLLCLLSGLLSAVMQNIGVMALFMPMIARISLVTREDPGRYLMPVAFCVLIGGAMTTIGSSPMLIMNDLLPPGMAPMGFAEPVPWVLPLLLGAVGVLYLLRGRLGCTRAAERLVRTRDRLQRLYGHDGQYRSFRLAESLPESFPVSVGDFEMQALVHVVAVQGDNIRIGPPRDTLLSPGNRLALTGQSMVLDSWNEQRLLQPCTLDRRMRLMLSPAESGVAEILVPPGSQLAGKTLKEIWLRKRYGLSLLAIHRHDERIHDQVRDTPLQVGDSLLVHTRWKDLARLEGDDNFAILTPGYPRKGLQRKRPWWVLGIFVISLVGAATAGPLSIWVLMTGALLVVLTGVVSMDEAYEAVSWRTVCLLGGLIPFGRALDHSGALAVLAEGFSFWMGPAAGILPLMLLLLLLATLMSLFVSNVGGMLLLVPLTLSLATQVGHDPRPLLMLVAIGIANAMMVPTNQVTAVIRVPGGYSNKDFFRVGGLTSLWLMVGALLLVGLSS